eukprot:NODE_1041_length_1497_cov_65.733577_g1030_i0.p1 GENE.NODE_1041_length_1497_cov_65.733577_g1030_i0~~NODE_1041_length_1497_cov_65.733577_g1030_i0.p1  ORF type:complete len:459 (+),score=86.30 NODE_1041_length_1497_cov_65.733577_g1030_i0:94-1470(+)
MMIPETSKDENVARSVAQEEADRALAMKLAGSVQDQFAAAQRVADGIDGTEQMRHNPDVTPVYETPQRQVLTSPSSYDPTPGSAQQMPLAPNQVGNNARAQAAYAEEYEPQVSRTNAKQLRQIRPRAWVVGIFAGALAALALIYLIGFVVAGDMNNSSGYHDPAWATALAAVVYIGAFATGLLGVAASWKKKYWMINGYCIGLLLVLLAKLCISIALTMYLKENTQDVLDSHGCGGIPTTNEQWSNSKCAEYEAEATAARWFWVFPCLLLLCYVSCGCWLRGALKHFQSGFMTPGMANTISEEMTEVAIHSARSTQERDRERDRELFPNRASPREPDSPLNLSPGRPAPPPAAVRAPVQPQPMRDERYTPKFGVSDFSAAANNQRMLHEAQADLLSYPEDEATEADLSTVSTVAAQVDPLQWRSPALPLRAEAAPRTEVSTADIADVLLTEGPAPVPE